ncbi:MAG: PCRF domain-containing protein, partial [Chloroflexota bacterium]
MINRLEQIEKQFQELEEQISRPEIATDPKQLQKLAKERARLEDVVNKYREYKTAIRSLEETRAMQSETLDEDMKAMVKQEI